MTRLWRITVGAGACIAALIALGYASNWISAGACEQRIARSLAAGQPARDVFVVPGPEYAGAAAILEKAGFRTTPCGPRFDERYCSPAAGVSRAKSVAPYVVSVKWVFVPGPRVGYDGTMRYFGGSSFTVPFFCLFGLVFELPWGRGWVS